MNYICSRIFIVMIAVILSACASVGKPFEQTRSKVLEPPQGAALVYVIRAPGQRGIIRPKLFVFNEEVIGKIWSDQYLYVYANPMQMLLPMADGSVHKLDIIENQTYYLMYGTESTFIDAVIDPFNWERDHFKILNRADGRKLVNEYDLSGEFRRVTIGRKTDKFNNTAKSSYPNTSEYIFESEKNKGGVTVRGGGNLRKKALYEISNICNTKNIALTKDHIDSITNATYITLSENSNNGNLHMKFQCVY